MGCTTRASRWLAQADEIALVCSDAEDQQQGACLVAMMQFLRRHQNLDATAEARAARFLSVDAYADAALALLPARCASMISQAGRGGLACASVRLDGHNGLEATATARTPGLALVAAYAQALVEAELSLAA
ncbi:hypothetical protein [Novosphingobium mangrovi (ex Hu et al. 2023)]|uniref:Uncharacterized protein n=1 Tax=Novosphingobium mangrovi (ex Hu et al. 2023) TaxID=2930094 RepID=A0ABT0A8B5_9SPHN|nr:hypothetical protein [Novosphingobium mangrovi (ex Hu et al. 2023)]MCJ1959433.1 hypothetical protein [Novosphingobium mangrovi (ex Hu et al. 2023)]